MIASNRFKGLGYIQYHSDPISNFKAYSTDKQTIYAYLIYENKSYCLEIPFEFKESESNTPWKFSFDKNYNNKPTLTIQEIYPIKQLKNYFKIEFVFYESKNPDLDPLWAYPRKFTAKFRFKGEKPKDLLGNLAEK